MRILHVFRSPVGGLFRHVRDLATAQAALGHDVGIFCDAATGGTNAVDTLAKLSAVCSLGVTREAMSKLPGFGDITCSYQALKLAKALNVDVIHGHGAKGGLYGRLAAKFGGKTGVYTPHGGSLHYDWAKFPGPVFLGTEWLLRTTNAGLVFVCQFERNLFARKIGLGECRSIVVHNGLLPEEFSKVALAPDARDLLFVGEMRKLKGVDVLLQALALLKPQRRVTAYLVGDGPDIGAFKALASELDLSQQVEFVGLKRMADALSHGRIFVLPSRNESFPYVMLEAVAAFKPVIASDVGGIGEVLGHDQLVLPDQPEALAKMIADYLDHPKRIKESAEALAQNLRQGSTVTTMAQRILNFYATLG
jgi:glycosyltransferase involved in cell wall biosynthesis